MSISYYLLSFSLCLSLLHACNPRPLGAFDNKKLEKKCHFSINTNDEKGIDKVPVLPKTNKSSLSNDLEATRGDSYRETSLLGDKAQNLTDKKMEATFNVPVSWLLPRNKRGEEHPELNSDYLLPRTHPPTHN